MHRMTHLLIVFAVVVLSCPIAVAQAQEATPSTSTEGATTDWMGFRGNPARTGVTSATGPVEQPAIRWQVETGGSGQNSPAVVDDVVYTKSNANLLLALDAATGTELWRYELQWTFSQPVVADGLVVVGGVDGLYSIDAVSGQERWLYQPNNTPRLFDSSPTVADGVVYVGDDGGGGLFAVDLATGIERWQFDTQGGTFASPAVADGTVYIATDTVFGGANVGVPSQVYAVDAATGTERWHYGTGSPTDTFFASPAVAGGVVLIGTQNANDDQTFLIAIDAVTGQERWRTRTARVFSSAAVTDGMVLFGSDALYGLDAATGQQVWRLAIGEVDSSPTVANGVVYAQTYERFLVAADAATGHELWHVPMGGGGFSSPAVVDGMVYVSSDDGVLYAFGEASGGQTANASPPPTTGGETAFAEVSGTTLIETTVTADQLPPPPTIAHAFVYTWPSGVGYLYQEDVPGVIVNCVVTGQWTYAPLKAGSDASDTATPTTDTETTLEAGDCVALPAGQHREERNPGPDSLSLLRFSIVPDGFFGPANVPPEIVGGPPIMFINSNQWGILAGGEISLMLEQVQLAPGAAIDAYEGEGIGLIAAPNALTTHISYRIDGSVRNLDDDPVDVFVLTITPEGNAAVATPEPATSETVEPLASPAATGDAVSFVWQTLGGPEPFIGAGGVKIAPDGTIWVVDSQRNRFQIFDADGTFIETWGTPGNGDGEFNFTRVNGDALGGIAFGPDGSIYVADSGNRRIQKFDHNRTFVTAWGGFGAGDGQLIDPFAIAVDANGNVYVADDRHDDVQEFSPDGDYLATFGEHGYGDGQLNFIGGLTVDADGSVLVADYGNNRIVRFAADGSFVAAFGEAGAGDAQFSHPADVAVDSAGRLYVADQDNHRVQILTPDGTFLASWGKEGEAPGQFITPVSLALDGDGNIYVAEAFGHRVQKFHLLPPFAPAATPTA